MRADEIQAGDQFKEGRRIQYTVLNVRQSEHRRVFATVRYRDGGEAGRTWDAWVDVPLTRPRKKE